MWSVSTSGPSGSSSTTRNSPASLVLPNLLGRLNAEVLSLHAFADEARTSVGATEMGANIGGVQRLVKVMGADLGLVIDPERRASLPSR